MNVVVLVAMDTNRGIGINNQLPWHIPEDLVRFKQQTSDQAIIMGRKTWESLPKAPLPNRLNIVLSRNPKALNLSVPAVSTLEDGIAIAQEQEGVSTIYIIGGSTVYQQAIEEQIATELIITQVSGTWECDTFFPNPAPTYQFSHTITYFNSNNIACRIEQWTRNISYKLLMKKL